MRNLAAARTTVLTANLTHVPENVIPWKLCEIGGFRIALIGLITPGLPLWLTRETLGGISPLDPGLVLARTVGRVKATRPDAIVVLGHFGHTRPHDFANPLRETLDSAPDIDVFIGGHTHVNVPSIGIGRTIYTQADHFGIHCGKVDLTFDTNSRKLVSKAAVTERMDERFDLDPAVIQLSQPALRESDAQLARVLTRLEFTIPGAGRDSPLASFLCANFAAALHRRSHPVDAVFHGTFFTGDLPAGPVTVADTWNLLPYENSFVTADLTYPQLLSIVEEDRKTRSDRTLWPYQILKSGDAPLKILDEEGELRSDRRFRIAFNSYDSQSAGGSLLKLRDAVHLDSSHREYIALNTRDALIDELARL